MASVGQDHTPAPAIYFENSIQPDLRVSIKMACSEEDEKEGIPKENTTQVSPIFPT